MAVSYIYGPVISWRSGTSLGIDPIGERSTCSFNCTYCQLGKIQEIITEPRIFVETQAILRDLEQGEASGLFKYEDLDVITFAGSGEPTLAKNLEEMILAIRQYFNGRNKVVPISILTNATLLNHKSVRQALKAADQVSLKLDAPNNYYLSVINQAHSSLNIEGIINGIILLRQELEALTPELRKPRLGLQLMFMPKYLAEPNFIEEMIARVSETGIKKIQINTPNRAKPIYNKNDEYWIASRGNHYNQEAPENLRLVELPVIDRATATNIENKFRAAIPDLEVINVYK